MKVANAKEQSQEIEYLTLISKDDFKFSKGPFKYYFIMFLTFVGPPTHLFDDL